MSDTNSETSSDSSNSINTSHIDFDDFHDPSISLLFGRGVVFEGLSPEHRMAAYHYWSSPAVLMNSEDGHSGVTRTTNYDEGVVSIIPIILNLNLIPRDILTVDLQFIPILFGLQFALTSIPVGVCHKIYENSRSFGTIGEINEQFCPTPRVAIIGRQRFEILEVLYRNDRCAVAQIKFIKDVTLTNPYNKLCLDPKKHNLGHGKMCRKRYMLQTQWPVWVYKQFDVNVLASCVSKKVKILCKNIEISDDPVFLSFQVTKLGIFSEEVVSKLLGISLTNQRLQCELEYLNNLVRNERN